ncbi:MAG: rhomboid family intramembrane serine protease [Bacteriovoracaceae bacterium]|nr:rhomboid family intramembrane serine protease [Bacteriovoracaceae bacterium]
MFIFGEIRDKVMAQEMVNELTKQGIVCGQHFVASENVFQLYVEDRESFAKARGYYEMVMGIKRPMEIDPEWKKIQRTPLGFVSKILIALSLLIFVFWKFGDDDIYLFLMISNGPGGTLDLLLSGEFWRIITPILIHFNFMHILFNLLWLKDLGSIIEAEKGSGYFTILVILSGVLSNLSQYFVKGPMFGGMSGVVYALLGHIWMYKRFNQSAKYSLPQKDVYMMVGWYFLCLFGLMGPIANIAHGVGLSVGMFMGISFGVKSSKSVNALEIAKFSSLALLFSIGTVVIESFK